MFNENKEGQSPLAGQQVGDLQVGHTTTSTMHWTL